MTPVHAARTSRRTPSLPLPAPEHALNSPRTTITLVSSVLLWRRSDNICFALLLGSGAGVCAGEGVECKIKAILQVRACVCRVRDVSVRVCV